MIRCHYCGTDNLDGSEFCDECGKRLAAPRAGSVPMTGHPGLTPGSLPPPPPSFTGEAINPMPATPYSKSSVPAPPTWPGVAGSSQHPKTNLGNPVGNNGGNSGVMAGGVENPRVRVVVPEAGAAVTAQVRARLVIQRGGKVGKEFLLYENEALIGRWDADGGIFPDIDLDQDDPEAKISRRHARLIQVNNQFLIEDLGSTNGTFINRGPRLMAGIKQPLNHGDEIIVGKTFLKFFLS
jgi:hypothetical protein